MMPGLKVAGGRMKSVITLPDCLSFYHYSFLNSSCCTLLFISILSASSIASIS